MISSWLGKRPASSFENTISPSTATSKMPSAPRISSDSIAERLLQCGRQTGGPRQVVSTHAVGDFDLHGDLLCCAHAASRSAGQVFATRSRGVHARSALRAA